MDHTAMSDQPGRGRAAVTWKAADDEARFREDMVLGQQWVLFVANQLAAHDVHGRIPAMKIRSQFEDRAAFRDTGDIYVGAWRIEVRSLQTRFTDVASWPYSHVRVDLVGVIESKMKAALILFVSRPCKAIVGWRPNQRHLQLERGVFDKRRGVARDWMVTTKDRLLDFDQCVAFLHERQTYG